MEIHNTYMIFKDDLQQMGLWKKAASLFTGAAPPHRYKGVIANMGNALKFSGSDIVEKTDVELNIDRNYIIQLYHGYDKIFNRWTVNGGGMWWAPIRIKFDPERKYGNNDLYIVSGFIGMNSSNKIFYEELKEWLS